MKQDILALGGRQLPVYICNTVIVGTGAAGYNAADCLYQNGQSDIAIVTEGLHTGTSRNTGSDKQTYYKLTLSGGEADSVLAMAETLFSGQCVDGDTALCEAALSTQAFYKLVALGVPFPHNRYGEYIGYKTDHDPRRRATSAGPYTSKMMTECLQKAVEEKNIPLFDNMQAVRLLAGGGNKIQGLLCIRLDAREENEKFVVFRCKNILLATGGPAGIYADSVYPSGQYGATGMALEAGAKGQNLTEWQYGLASIKPRWNVSGTYMQTLPRFISTDRQGGEEREFLCDAFAGEKDLLGRVFLKGYQWPFDARKAREGSSAIDIAVYRETAKGRRVFLDFRNNPGNKPLNFRALPSEARAYLEKAGACFGTPIERLLHMNAPAADFFAEQGVDLAREPLEIALCAQHCNGGLSVDYWWQTSVEGLFAAGEIAGTHGVYRPGGSALNAGQVGSARAAQYIAARRTGLPDAEFARKALDDIADALDLAQAVLSGGAENARAIWDSARRKMSLVGGPVRSPKGLAQAAAETANTLQTFRQNIRIAAPSDIGKAFRLRDTLLCQQAFLEAMLDYVKRGGKSRGSALYGENPSEAAPFSGGDALGGQVQEMSFIAGQSHFHWRDVRPIPQEDDFFENVWRDFREDRNIR